MRGGGACITDAVKAAASVVSGLTNAGTQNPGNHYGVTAGEEVAQSWEQRQDLQ